MAPLFYGFIFKETSQDASIKGIYSLYACSVGKKLKEQQIITQMKIVSHTNCHLFLAVIISFPYQPNRQPSLVHWLRSKAPKILNRNQEYFVGPYNIGMTNCFIERLFSVLCSDFSHYLELLVCYFSVIQC